LQHALGSACAPVWGASSNVIAISPLSRYAAEPLIMVTTLFRNASAGFSPADAFGAHGLSLPLSHAPGVTYAKVGAALATLRSLLTSSRLTSFWPQALWPVTELK
jgi:hypothetical protein